MPTLEERVYTLEQQAAHQITRAQAQALVDALNADITTLSQTISDLQAVVNNLVQKVQTAQNQLANHETRIAALEGP